MQQVSENVRIAAAACFAIDPASLLWIGGTDGSVYSVRKGSREHILKIAPVDPEGIAPQHEILDFKRFLAEHDVPVALPLPSEAGRPLEVIQDGQQHYLVTLMLHADGKPPQARNAYVWNNALFQVWGRVMGRMHALAKRYPRWRREESVTTLGDFRTEHQFFAEWSQDAEVTARWWELLPALEALPIEREGYGLIHNDLHNSNFLYHPQARSGWPITIIDFDVSAYYWFINDIAIAIFHAVAWGTRTIEKRREFARAFTTAFMNGYAQENTLDDAWWQYLPLFLRYRDFVLFTAMSHEWPLDKRDRWQRAYLSGMHHRIMTGKTIL